MKVSHKLKQRLAIAASLTSVLGTVFVPGISMAAGTLSNRSVQLSNSAKSGTSTYTLTLTGSGATAIRSIDVQACTTAFGTCTAVTGFNWNAATNPSAVTGSFGTTASNWGKGTTTANDIQYAYGANAAAGNTAGSTIAFAGVTNPGTSNTPYYLRITTYSDGTYTTALDTGNVVFAVTDAVQVQGTVQEQLTFCVYTATCLGGVVNPVQMSTGTNCTGGILQSGNICTGTSKFDIFTNGNGGGSVYYTGTAFTNQNSPGNSFTTLGNGVASSPGSEQFGIACSSVTVSANTTNCPTAANTYSYGLTANTVIGTIAGGTSSTGNTITYGANIATTTKPGVYQASLTYSATATF